MKLLILGHSYVRDLSQLNIFNFSINQREINIKYVHSPGAGYDKFLSNPSILEDSVKYQPDIVVVILGGNSISRDITVHELFHKCREFYKILKGLLPETIIIAAQVELRHYKSDYRGNSLSPAEFLQKRNSLNQFLKRLKYKNNLLIIAGPGRLDSRDYYKADGVHLTRTGLKVYMSILKSTVAYALDNKYKR